MASNIKEICAQLLEKHIAQLSVLLSSTATAATTLQIFVDMASTNPEPFVSQLTILKQTAGQQPAMLGLVAAIFGAVGKTSQVGEPCFYDHVV